MAKYLDNDGVLYLWNKIKTLVGGKVDKVSGKGLSTNDYTTAEKNKLSGIAAGANNYIHPTSAGNKHIPTGGSANQYLKWSASGAAEWADQTEIIAKVMTGATASAAGTSGIVPAPAAGKHASFLRGDGTWVVPTNTTYGLATTSANGLMSSIDKGRVDNLYKRIAGFAVTEGTTSAFTATIPGVTLTEGTAIILRFHATNAAGATLNVNGLGVKKIMYRETQEIPFAYVATNAIMLLLYMSGGWYVIFQDKLVASTSRDGLMSKEDKVSLDDLKISAITSVNGLSVDTCISKELSIYGSDQLVVTSNKKSGGVEIELEVNTVDVASGSANSVPETVSVRNYVTNQLANYALKSDITNMYKHKGSVAAVANLPTSNNKAGDVWNVTATGMNYVWTGSAWDALGEIFSIDSITNAELDAICV